MSKFKMSKKDLRALYVVFYLIVSVVLIVVLGVMQFITPGAFGLLLWLFASLAAWIFVLDDTDYDDLGSHKKISS